MGSHAAREPGSAAPRAAPLEVEHHRARDVDRGVRADEHPERVRHLLAGWRCIADEPDLRVIIVCNEGYSSSLAAHSLQKLGVSRATDLVGGYRAWQAFDSSVVTDL